MKKMYLECGKIVGAHGIRGAMRVECYCDSPAVLAKLPTVYIKRADGSLAPYQVERGAVKPPQALLTLAGITAPEQVMPLRGTLLYAHRKDIPLKKGDYFLVDLLGLPVIDADSGVRYGELLSVYVIENTWYFVRFTEDGEVFKIHHEKLSSDAE